MKILAVVYCFPPLLVPATMCYVKLITGLRAQGVDVEVVSISPDSFDAPGENLTDEALCRAVPKNIVNHVVRSPESTPIFKMIKRFGPLQHLLYRLVEPRKREWTIPARRYLARLDLFQRPVVGQPLRKLRNAENRPLSSSVGGARCERRRQGCIYQR
jgi:hypothetical protein